MSTSQRARSGVPLDQRSVLASVPGVPAWGAFAIATGATVLGIVVDAARGTELTSAFSSLYIIGCVAAVLLVRSRGLFTAMAQAPLIIFFAVPIAYQFMTQNAGTGLKDIILNVALPLVNRFPIMLLGTALTLVIGGIRLFIKRRSSHARTSARERFADKREARKSERADAVAPQAPPRGRNSVWASENDDYQRSPAPRTAAPRTAAPRTPAPRTAATRNPAPRNPAPRTSAPITPPVQRREAPYGEPRYDRFANGSTRPARESPYGRTSADPDREPRHQPRATPPPAPRYPKPNNGFTAPTRGYGRSAEQVGRFSDRYSEPNEPYVAPRTPPAESPAHPVPRVRYRDRPDPNPDGS